MVTKLFNTAKGLEADHKSMRARILIYSIVIILISVIVTSVVSVNTAVERHIDDKITEMSRASLLIHREVSLRKQAGAEVSLPGIAADYAAVTALRITFIDTEGNVLADSEAGEDYIHMENHSDREEVAAALEGRTGISRHESASFGREYLYFAQAHVFVGAAPDGGEQYILRIAFEIDKMEIADQHVVPTAALSALIGIVIGIVIAALYTRRLTQPIRAMERQLVETLELNKKAENIRKEFVANVTHELKTPLTSISGFAETLQGSAGEKPEVRARFLEIISLESARLARLIDDTLIISDIENGRDVMSGDGDIDVKQAIGEVVSTLLPMASANGIELSFDAQYEMHIGGDEGRFKQMMFNLVENAVKYSGTGKHVFIRAEKEDDIRVRVSIRDEGIGIMPEDIPRIFERFYRVDKSRSRDAGGTGLGLAIVKHIASLFDATIEVESEPGAGSVFTIYFPAG